MTLDEQIYAVFSKPLDMVEEKFDAPRLKFDSKFLVDVVERILPKYQLFNVPENRSIYHYTSQSGLQNILESNSLWFSLSDFQNDTTEGKYIYEVLSDVLYEYSKTKYKNNNYFKEFTRDVLRSIININDIYIFCYSKDNRIHRFGCGRRYHFICSFCQNRDSLNMWKYYSKSNDMLGANIKFKINEILKDQNDYIKNENLRFPKLHCFQVLYDKNNQKQFIGKVVELFYKFWIKTTDENKSHVLQELALYLHDIKFTMKHPSFKDEQEIRFVEEISNETFCEYLESDIVKLRPDKNGFIPYIEIPFDKSDVKQITASPNMKNYETINYLLKKLGYGADIKVTQSSIPWRS